MLHALAAIAIVASTITPTAPTSPTEPPATEHCAVEIIAAPNDSVPGEDIVCFATETERDDYVSAQTTSPLSRAGSVKLGTAYKGTNLTGSSLAFWGTGTCASATYGFATLASDWVTGMRSITGSGCSVWVYSASNYGGSNITCLPACNSLGPVTGTAKSLVFRP